MSHPRLLEGAINAFRDQNDAAAYETFMEFSYEALLRVANDRWISVPFAQHDQTRKPELVRWMIDRSAEG